MQRPQYRDPKTNDTYDTNNPNFEGWLTKQSVWLKDWRRRYFVLKGSKLFFAKSTYSEPHGMIDLKSCISVKSAEIKVGKKNSLEVSSADTTFFMYADTEKEKDEWIGAVGRAIVQSSSTFTTDDGKDADNSDEDEDD